MTTTINALRLRRRLGREHWRAPVPHGPDGWRLEGVDAEGDSILIVVSAGPAPGGSSDWLHASISRPDRLPSYDDLCMLHRAVWGDTGWAYQVFAPPDAHVNIHPRALHLWGLPDGAPVMPNFGARGTI
jgi:hypothetical protein